MPKRLLKATLYPKDTAGRAAANPEGLDSPQGETLFRLSGERVPHSAIARRVLLTSSHFKLSTFSIEFYVRLLTRSE